MVNIKKLIKAVDKAGGNYYEVAAAEGLRPYKVHDALVACEDLAPELRGKMAVYRQEGQRLQNARRFQTENNKLRRELRAASDYANMADDISRLLGRRAWPKRPLKVQGKRLRNAPDDRPVEILFSDLHYGKTCDGFNPDKAQHRVEQYADAIITTHKRVKPTRTTIAFLGDLIENANKHRDSQTGSAGMTTAEQIVGATRLIKHFLERVIPTCGQEIDIVGVAGNHENPFGAGASMAAPGSSHFTWIIYSLLADHFGGCVKDITWHVPRGNFVEHDATIYEHGDDSQPNDRSMSTQLLKRSRQVGRFCSRYRQGDKHVAVAVDGGLLICNGAFYSDRKGTEYSGIKGYASRPTQVHVLPCGVVDFVRLT